MNAISGHTRTKTSLYEASLFFPFPVWGAAIATVLNAPYKN